MVFKLLQSTFKPFSRSSVLGKRSFPCRTYQGCGSGDDSDKNPVGYTENPSGQTMYEVRKWGHNLPSNDVCPNFELLPDFPSGIFRNTTGESLGRGAGKCTYYQNPEYFSYHHMSFYDMIIHLEKYRNGCPNLGRKPV